MTNIGWYEEAIDALRAQEKEPCGWISVEDRLPRFNKEVLTYTPNMALPIMLDAYDGFYGEDDDEWHEGWRWRGDVKENKITHWMPLPEPPMCGRPLKGEGNGTTD